MEESSERLVRLGQHEIPEITCTVDDVSIQSTPQDVAVSAIYDRMMVDLEEEELLGNRRTYNQIREIEPETFLWFTPIRYSDFVVLPEEEEEEEEEECQRPRPALRKARRRRDPPPRVSRRFSQVSPPIYLRHRFLPQSRKDSSSRRQR